MNNLSKWFARILRPALVLSCVCCVISITKTGDSALLRKSDIQLNEARPNHLSRRSANPASVLLSSSSWSNTGSLNSFRVRHTATLLLNGKVLVVGGNYNSNLSSTELYDPATGMWTQTGSMLTARTRHIAVLLPNGKVLVAGGLDSIGAYTNTAEIYDPSTGTWSATGGMTTPRSPHTSTLLSSGKVLVAGGFGNGYLSSAELYDPVSGTWSSTGAMNHARAEHTMTLLSNGRVLVVGGLNSSSPPPLTTAEIYDPATSSTVSRI
jgi:hypothetical protein